jgi:hypothetical protein
MKECHNCGVERERIAQHWSMSSTCEAPRLTTRQKEIINGLMLGDGSVVRETKNPRLKVNSRKKEFLSFLDREMGVFSARKPEMTYTAQELAEADRDSGFHEEAKAENYGDRYDWETICSKRFNQWRSWYHSGEKVWPDNLDLTPLTMSMWYASDASYDGDHGRGRVTIDTAKEKDNRGKILGYFEEIPVEKPAWDDYRDYSTMRFSAEGTQELLEYMNTPVPGYEYKWGEMT